MNYFEYRKVSPSDYIGFSIPVYLRNAISNILCPKILDFGCGYGQMLLALCEAGFDADGLEIEPDAIRFCLGKGLNCIDGNEDYNFYQNRKEHYDFVIMSHVLEHFSKDEIIPQLEKIKNLIKPGGAAIVMVPNAQSNTGSYWAYEDFTHHFLFTSGSLYYVLKAAGFEDIEFLDIDCTLGLSTWKRFIKKFLLKLYTFNYFFWNEVTSSSFHRPSPVIFSYEIKALALKK